VALLAGVDVKVVSERLGTPDVHRRGPVHAVNRGLGRSAAEQIARVPKPPNRAVPTAFLPQTRRRTSEGWEADVHVGVSLVSDMSARVPARHQAVSSPSADRFDAIVISGKVGVHKPEPKVFTLVVQLLAVMAPETVLVDDLAHNFGLPTT
jgi:beta-phosphoglucomutase-like phosphatase (HAD superfamily)